MLLTFKTKSSISTALIISFFSLYSIPSSTVKYFDKSGKDYLKTVKSDLIIQRKISDTDIAQKYELTASLIYDILTNSNTYKFETSNKPIIKTSA